MSKLDGLRITECPAAFAEFARAHNALVDLLLGLKGVNGLKVTLSERNGVIGFDPAADIRCHSLTATGDIQADEVFAGYFESAGDIFASAEVYRNGVPIRPIAWADITNADSSARAAVLPIAWANITNADSSARAAVLPIAWANISDAEVRANSAAANYVANYTNENVYNVCIANVSTPVTFIVKA